MEIAAAFHESDVPPGVFNALSGAGREVDDELAQNANVDVLSYAGMPADLRRVAERAARTLKRSMFDAAVGGTAIVLEDADLDATIAGISWGAFALAGRVWRRCARVVVSRAIADPVAYHLARTAAALRVGGPGSFETDIGPQASTDAAAASARAVRRAVEAGAVAATPPLQPPGPAFAMPAVLRAFPDSPVAWDELPGPALLVVTVNDAAEAIEIANRPPSRAAASVWSRDLPRALAVARRLAADVLWVNDHVPTRRVGDGIAFEDADGLERRSPVGVARAGSLRDKPWLATLGLDRVLGA
jgi:acyl-CoA reductase-like NAD-dependent aldehyde dehydrogenase